MVYRAELSYLMSAFEKMNLQALLITPENIARQRPDFGLRKILGLESIYEQAIRNLPKTLQGHTIYKLTDGFLCNYFLLRLPEEENTFLLIGPYLSFRLQREWLMEKAEQYNISALQFDRMERCFAEVRILADDGPVYAMLSAFGEILWGKGSAFEFSDLNLRHTYLSPQASEDAVQDPESLVLHIKTMEKRYAYENELIDLVSQGLSSRAEQMVRYLPSTTLDQRSTDPIRNIKNYCIVCNTLLRKAAEKGGVHPVQLDKFSASLARKIELISATGEGTEIMCEMVRTYCRLVRQCAIGRYPPLVQRTLSYMDANLAGDLSLRTLAQVQNVSGSYLSSMFHREYGKTVTECVMEKRMEAAAGLLLSTHLQVQTVAQHCGFSDVNYFSKTFKRFYGVTPRQYRERGADPLGYESVSKNHLS